MSKLLNVIKCLPKRTSAMVAMVAAAVVIPATLYAWGPSRQTYTIEKPADHVTFNSITNNPSHGDERNFMQVREATADNSTYSDSISLTAGKEYVVYVYYHNNAASNLNASGVGIARGAYVKAEIPAVVANGGSGTKAVGYVGADNASPKEVWDDITFKNTTGGDIALRYVPSSATIHSWGAVNGKTMSDSIITTGAPLGFDSLNGVLPGCEHYAGFVTFRVKADQPNFTISKQVRKSTTAKGGWVETVSVNPGDSVDYMITYVNTGTTNQKDVVIKDVLPKGMTYVTGSTYVMNASSPNGVKVSDNIVSSNGINIGDYVPGGNAYVKFTAKVVSNDSLPNCGTNTLVNTAKAETNNGSKTDTASVTATKTCETPTVCYTCDSLSVAKLSRTSFRFTTEYSMKNATFKNVTYVIRDANGNTVDTKTNTAKTLDYTQAKVGKYTVQATITAVVDGKEKTATSESCKTSFEVTKENIPEELPTTGAGEDIAALIGIGATVTAAGYYIASRRALESR